MIETRNSLIKKYYTEIEINPGYLELYSVRKAIFESIKSNLPKFKGLVLDLGCGIMPYREFILENSKATQYLGLDFENSLHKEYELIKPDLFWDGITINLADNSVDSVLATEVLEHCANPDVVLKEVFRVLKPGGCFIFTVPFLWNIHLVPNDEYRYTPFSLRRLLENSRFTNIELEALGLWDASLAQMIGIWYKNRPSRFKKSFSFLFARSIKFLLKKDKSFDKSKIYSEGIMISGIAGTALKIE